MKVLFYYFFSIVFFVTSLSKGESTTSETTTTVPFKFNSLVTVENTAKNLCIKNSIPFNSENYKNICEIVRNSDFCQNEIKGSYDDMLKCDSISENTVDIFSFGAGFSCIKGLFASLGDLLSYLGDLVSGILGYAFSPYKRDSFNSALGSYYESFKNYIFLEYSKQLDQTNSESKALANLVGDISVNIYSALVEKINTENAALGCYNQSARQKKICQILGQYLVPPTVALGILMKGSAILRMIKSSKIVRFFTVKDLGKVGKVADLTKDTFASETFLSVAWNPKTKEMYYAPSEGAKLVDGTAVTDVVQQHGGHAIVAERTGDKVSKYLGGGIIVKDDRLIVSTKSIGLNGMYAMFFNDGKMSLEMQRNFAQEIANKTRKVTQLKDSEEIFYPK